MSPEPRQAENSLDHRLVYVLAAFETPQHVPINDVYVPGLIILPCFATAANVSVSCGIPEIFPRLSRGFETKRQLCQNNKIGLDYF